MSLPFLTTKLYIPPPGKYRIERQRLAERLTECLHPGCRLALVSAPAGFGKTTLVSGWVTAQKALDPNLSAAWLSIDDGDNDPVIFWTYLVSALQMQRPEAEIGKQTLNLLSTAGAPNLKAATAALVNDLVHDPHTGLLVLDDYHLIRSQSIQESLAFFVEHIPPQFHLVIASRTDPPLPLALLRGRGQMLELRLNDLRFTDADAETYINAGLGLNLAAPSVQALNQKTEGWIAGLQMAAISLRDAARGSAEAAHHPERLEQLVASFSGNNRYILDYLLEEVLSRQPQPIQDFLMRTSILDRLCPPLCDALMEEGEAQPVLEYLESCNLFILPLDNQRYWYRYHQLFADLLRKRLSQVAPGLAAGLHLRAMRWYEQNGFIPNAVEHALRAKDYSKAAALVAQIGEALWGRGEHATLLAWMDALPEEEKRRYPHLLVFQVSMLISAGKLAEAEKCIPVLERYIQTALEANPENTWLAGNIAALRTYIASFYGDRPALYRFARAALEGLTREADAGQRCGVLLVLSNAYLTDGALEPAGQALVEAIAAAKKARRPHMALTGIANLAAALCLQGNLGRAAQVCQEGLPLIEQYGMDRSPMAADLMIGWGAVLVERRDFATAEKAIRQGLEAARAGNYLWQMAWGGLVEARLLLAQGDLAAAEAAAQSTARLAQAHEIPAYFRCETTGLLAKIWMRQGKPAQAGQYLHDLGIAPGGELAGAPDAFPHAPEYLALSRLQWAQGNLESAAAILERILRGAEANRQTCAMVSALLLQALVSQSRNDRAQAEQSLGKALDLAEPEAYAQVFVEEGDALVPLLEEAALQAERRGVRRPDRQNIHSTYARRLLEAFPISPAAEPKGARPAAEPVPPGMPPAVKSALIEPLSRRELETLRLIAEGDSNKEIAQKLSISLRTVKYYTTGIFNKLGVDGRMQAVIRARELGIID